MKMPVSSSQKFDFQQLSEDFKRLNNNDPGTWPLIPTLTVFAGIFIAITALGGYFLWLDQFDVLSQAEAKEARLKEDFLEKKRQAVNLDLYRQQLEEIDKSFGALLKQLPNRNEVESLLVEVNQAGLGRGLQFELFKPAAEVVKDFYAELPINVKINGAYHDLGAFAADVAKLPRIVTLNDVNISVSGGKEGGGVSSGRLVMDMQVKTFRYLDEEEMAKRRQEEKAKGGKGK